MAAIPNRQEVTYYPRNPNDIRDATASLTKLFHNLNVPHLTDVILDYAEYWLRIEKTRHDNTHIESWNFGPFLSAPPIPECTRRTSGKASYCPVRKVRWTVWALDAEWRFDRQRTDGKAWSYWVTTKGSSKHSARKPPSRNTSISNECECQSPRKPSLPSGLTAIEDEEGGNNSESDNGDDFENELCTRWGHRSLSTYSALREDWLKMPHLDTDKRKDRERFAGKNVFSTDYDVLAVPLEDWEEGPEVARLCQRIRRKQKFQFECSVFDDGEIADWIRGLESGDRVALTSKAPFNARECHTEGARIEVFYAWWPD